MASRPSTYLDWTDGAPAKVVQPPTNKQLQGWVAAEAPPFQYMNWLFWLTDQWIQFLDQTLEGGSGELGVRLINGGFWTFDASADELVWSASANLSIPGIVDSDNFIPSGNVTILDGQICYLSANLPLFSNAATQSGNNIITVSFPGGIVTGMTITGPGIPSNTTVTGASGNQVQMSANATATSSSVLLTFSSTANLVPTVVDNDTFEPATNDLVIARRVGKVIYLGNNATQMTLQDGESKLLVGAGYEMFTANAGAALTQGQAVYISIGGADGGRTAGSAYPADAGASFGPTRYQFVGFVLETVAMNQAATIVSGGIMGNFSGLTPGQTYWVNPATPGAITLTPPTGAHIWVIPVGIAISATQIAINQALSSTAALFGGSGGGGGSALLFQESTNSPISTIGPTGVKTYAFAQGEGQILYAAIKVPQNYLTGTQIFAYVDFYSPDNTGTAFMQAITTLVRQGTDAINFTGNQQTSTNTAVTLGSGTVNIPQGVVLDLTDVVGEINGVTVNPGDLLLVQLTRGTDTGASDLQVPTDASSLAI